MQLTSPAFANQETVPVMYTCNGPNINPPLRIIDAPENTACFALTVVDTNATPTPWYHWFVFNIPATIREIAEGSVPAGATEGLANGGTPGYEGPCPIYFTGTHRYEFTLYALNKSLDLPGTTTFDEAKNEIAKYLVAKAKLTGIAEGTGEAIGK